MLRATALVALHGADVPAVGGGASGQGSLVTLTRGVIALVGQPVALVGELGQDRRVASLAGCLRLSPRQVSRPRVPIVLALASVTLHSWGG